MRGGVTHLTVAPVHQRKFLPPDTSALSISSKGKQTNRVYGRERESRSGLRRFQGIRGQIYLSNQRRGDFDIKL